MYQEVIDDMKKRKHEIQDKINILQEELKPHDEALKAIQKLQENYMHEKYKAEGILAVQTGVCPFPRSPTNGVWQKKEYYDCKHRDTCTDKSCNADTCSNGHAYRFS